MPLSYHPGFHLAEILPPHQGEGPIPLDRSIKMVHTKAADDTMCCFYMPDQWVTCCCFQWAAAGEKQSLCVPFSLHTTKAADRALCISRECCKHEVSGMFCF